MAGYNGFSKSNNAVEAERSGLMTATQAAKALGVSSRAIKTILTPDEWHHTSSYFNKTNYYSVESLLAASQAKTSERVWENCTIEWLEWGGTRKHPVAIERHAVGCTISWAGGSFCEISGGALLRKKIDCKGFYAYDHDGKRIKFELITQVG